MQPQLFETFAGLKILPIEYYPCSFSWYGQDPDGEKVMGRHHVSMGNDVSTYRFTRLHKDSQRGDKKTLELPGFITSSHAYQIQDFLNNPHSVLLDLDAAEEDFTWVYTQVWQIYANNCLIGRIYGHIENTGRVSISVANMVASCAIENASGHGGILNLDKTPTAFDAHKIMEQAMTKIWQKYFVSVKANSLIEYP